MQVLTVCAKRKTGLDPLKTELLRFLPRAPPPPLLPGAVASSNGSPLTIARAAPSHAAPPAQTPASAPRPAIRVGASSTTWRPAKTAPAQAGPAKVAAPAPERGRSSSSLTSKRPRPRAWANT